MATNHSTLREDYIKRTGHAPGRAVAVKLFCVDCMGGERAEARRCKTRECLIWPYGLAAAAIKRGEKVAKDTGEAFDPTKVNDGEVLDDVIANDEPEAPEDADEGDDGEATAAPAPEAKPAFGGVKKRGALPPVGTQGFHKNKEGTILARVIVQEDGLVYQLAGTDPPKPVSSVFTSMSASALAAAHDLGLNLKGVNGWDFWGVKR